jgi:hypothetical protein
VETPLSSHPFDEVGAIANGIAQSRSAERTQYRVSTSLVPSMASRPGGQIFVLATADRPSISTQRGAVLAALVWWYGRALPDDLRIT